MLYKYYCYYQQHSNYSPVSQVATRRQVQSHDAVMWLEQRSVDSKVSRRARVGLHIDSPLCWVAAVGLQSSVAAQVLNLVYNLVAAVVSCVWQALSVLLGESFTNSSQQ
jgi:hypothetical protein